MMHDLFLHPPPGQDDLSFDEIFEKLRDSETLAPYVNYEDSTPEQLVLTDPDTGVWALVTPGGPFIDEDHEPDPRVLHIQLPYARPRFFAIEGALFVLALVQELGGTIEDPADPEDPSPRSRKEEELVASWERRNVEHLAELSEQGDEGLGGLAAQPGDDRKRIDRTLLESVFSQNLHRLELQGKAGSEVEVPRLVLASLPLRREPAVVCSYTAGNSVWLPDAVTHVVLRRRRKSWLGSKEEELLVDADALRKVLSPFERSDEAPGGMRAFHPTLEATDPRWQALDGKEARGLAVIDWNEIVDA